MSAAELLEKAIRHLERLADPAEMAGQGDATEPHNHTPEMRARLAHAARAARELREHLAGELSFGSKPVTVPASKAQYVPHLNVMAGLAGAQASVPDKEA